MIEFSELHGAVYVFENPEAQRVKIGTTLNKVVDRLRDLNDLWLGRKGTCQVCGGRLVTIRGCIPQHVAAGRRCSGGHALPLEKSAAVAEKHLASMKGRLSGLSGVQLASITRKINALERRIGKPRHHAHAVGVWELSVAFFTERAGEVELLSHSILKERLDKTAPLGEIFSCSVSEAMNAVEWALGQLGLAQSAGKESAPDSTAFDRPAFLYWVARRESSLAAASVGIIPLSR